MSKFLINGNKTYSYNELLGYINEDGYYPLLKTHHLFDFFINLVKALVNNKPLILLDSDLNSNELVGVEEKQINKQSPLSTKKFSTIDEVVQTLQCSNSDITIFTSGTTGQPKKVVHSIQTLTRSVRLGVRYRGQIWAYAYNPTHMAGLQVFFQAFENQNTIVNVFNLSRIEVYHLIEKHHITHISATPTFYRLLLPLDKSYNSVERVTLGGEKSDQHLYDMIHRIFPKAKINNVYASTEAGTLFASKGDVFQIPQEINTLIKILDGELLIHKSLLGQSDSFNLDGEYYHSGDLIEWVNKEERIFKFKSRKNELINVGGYKINPSEVEFVLNGIDGIQQAFVYGKANSVLGNILCAEIQLVDGTELSELDVRKLLKAKLQDFKIPRRIKFVKTFTLTRTGKLQRL